VFHSCFIKVLAFVVLFSACAVSAWAEKLHAESELIAQQIADYLDPSQPLFLDIRCGEWTPALNQSLSKILLERSFDLRQSLSNSPLRGYEPDTETPNLTDYGIDSAVLASVELSLKWKILEHKNFFSYRTERIPVYSFITKQTKLPENRLLRIDDYDFVPDESEQSSFSAPRLQWFEPIIVGTAVASIIFLLWTIE